MHNINSLIVSLLACLMCLSCGSDPSDDIEVKAPATYSFSIDKRNIEAKSSVSEETIYVKTNGSWKTSTNASWINVTPSNGNSDASVKVFISENNTSETRNGELFFTCVPKDSIVSVKISQTGKSLTLSQDSLYFSASGETKSVVVTTEGDYSVKSIESWTTTNIKGNELSIIAEENLDPNERKGKVIVEAGALSKEVAIIQLGKNYVFNVDQDSIGSTSKAFSDLISLTTSDDWTAKADVDWITPMLNSGKGDANININVAENNTTSKREGKITLTGAHSGKSVTTKVTQEGKYLTVSPESLSFSAASDSKKIEVSTDGTFTTTKEGEWFSVSTEGNIVTVAVEKNVATTGREGSVTISLTGLTSGELSRKIVIKQSAENYTFIVTKTSISSTSSASNSSFSITTNDDWKISTKESWITLSATSGSGDKNITVNLSENKTTDLRTGEITISGTNSGSTEKISVTQDGKYLTVSPSTVSFGSDANSQKVTVSTDGTFTTSKSDSWISVSTSGSSITISVTENTAKDSRCGSATISLSDLASGILSQTIAVLQAGKEYYLNTDKTSISVGSSSSSDSFTITSNDSWSASSDAGWAKLSATTGSGNKTITVSIDANSSTSKRTSTISVKGSNGSTRTITISQEGKKASESNDVNKGHEYVDLGLPSGLLWATCNVGASSPEDYGDYFAWGETTTKSIYYWSTYKYCNASSVALTKYNFSSSVGIVDNKTVLDLDDDAAHVNWGESWRMPTKAEQDELRDTNNCTWSWTTQNGVNGYKVTSKKNGNSVFLPAAGYLNFSSLYDAGTSGRYWSSSLDSSIPSRASCFVVNSSYVGWGNDYRLYGWSVRPVCESSK